VNPPAFYVVILTKYNYIITEMDKQVKGNSLSLPFMTPECVEGHLVFSYREEQNRSIWMSIPALSAVIFVPFSEGKERR
jgi:hypothetical protein